MENITIKKTGTFKMQTVNNKTWGWTVNIKQISFYILKEISKKLAYAGGCGYDKNSACLSSFFVNHILEFDNYDDKLEFINKMESGAVSSVMSGIVNTDNLKEFLKQYNIDFKLICSKNNNKIGGYLIFEIKEFEEVRLYKELNSKLESSQEIIKRNKI